MNQKNFAGWLKAVVLGIGIFGLLLYGYVFPVYGKALCENGPLNPEAYWPWMILIWTCAVPCYMVLFYGWKVAKRIGEDQSFCPENAEALKQVSRLAAFDSIYLFAGNVLFMIVQINVPALFAFSLVWVFAGGCVTIAAAALSHLVYKAAMLQEESDLTI